MTARTCLLILLLLVQPVSASVTVIERDGQILELDIHELLMDERRERIRNWVTSTADAMAGVMGRWPRDHWRVVVQPGGVYTLDPVPWAQVNRGDPDTVSLYIDAMASEEKLMSNWTAYHEFAHLLIPYRGWGDLWFSEGLASYYQNLLQARHGVFDEREMWQRLYDGFVRGQTNKRPDLSLSRLSDVMWQNSSYMRVYWSGAWYFLKADIELRRRGEPIATLDAALVELNRCCANRALSARAIARRLDSTLEQPLFVPLFDEIAASREMPPFDALFGELGVSVDGGRVSLQTCHPLAALRQRIAENPG